MLKRRVVLIGLSALLLFVAGCGDGGANGDDVQSDPAVSDDGMTFSEQESQEEATSVMLRGFSISPRSFTAEDFTRFLDHASDHGQALTWAGDWIELSRESAAHDLFVMASRNQLEPVVIANFFRASTRELLRPLDDGMVRTYIESAAAFAEEHQPPYLGFGIEINLFYEAHPEEFDVFAALFSETYAAVRAVSPETMVFTTFQLEKMKGLHGGLFGGENDPADAQWHLIDLFDQADAIAFTTYPSLIYHAADDLPHDYYAMIAEHVDKPILFIEIGWHSGDTIPGWEGSEEEQAAYIQRLPDMMADINPALLIWSFMYDQEIQVPFDTIGLISTDGEPKRGWEAWKQWRP